MFALTFPAEFRNVQAHYPIVFQQDRGRKVPVDRPVRLPGQGRTCSSARTAGMRSYVPLTIERQPFLIGFAIASRWCTSISTVRASAGPKAKRCSATHGGIDRLSRAHELGAADDSPGPGGAPAFIAALLQHDLLESFVLDVELDDGSQNRLAGFYTINEERLGALDARRARTTAQGRLSAGDLHGDRFAVALPRSDRAPEPTACCRSLTQSRRSPDVDPQSLSGRRC